MHQIYNYAIGFAITEFTIMLYRIYNYTIQDLQLFCTVATIEIA